MASIGTFSHYSNNNRDIHILGATKQYFHRDTATSQQRQTDKRTFSFARNSDWASFHWHCYWVRSAKAEPPSSRNTPRCLRRVSWKTGWSLWEQRSWRRTRRGPVRIFVGGFCCGTSGANWAGSTVTRTHCWHLLWSPETWKRISTGCRHESMDVYSLTR